MTFDNHPIRLGHERWDRPEPGPIWSAILRQAALDGRGLRAWQRWIRWSNPGRPLQRLARLGSALMELATIPLDAARAVRMYGGKVVAGYGISARRQFIQLMRVRLRGDSAVSYYKFQLFRPDRWKRSIHFIEDAGVLLQVLSRRVGPSEDAGAVMHKDDFDRWARREGIACPQTLGVIPPDGRVAWSVERLPPVDLFVKPTSLRAGRGAALWRCSDVGKPVWQDGQGRVVDAAGLEACVAEEARKHGQAFVVQVALRNHPGLQGVTNGALATVRLMTVRDGHAIAQPLLAVLRMPVGQAVADNFVLGGLAAPIDLDSGTCGEALTKRGDYPLDSVTTHPDSGSTIQGLRIPCWAACVRLACLAHDRLQAEVAVIGWDVAVLADGPVLVEANYLPDGNLAQMPTRMGLGETAFAGVVVRALRSRYLPAHRS